MWICLTIIFVFTFFLVVGLLTKDKKEESKDNSLLESATEEHPNTNNGEGGML